MGKATLHGFDSFQAGIRLLLVPTLGLALRLGSYAPGCGHLLHRRADPSALAGDAECGHAQWISGGFRSLTVRNGL